MLRLNNPWKMIYFNDPCFTSRVLVVQFAALVQRVKGNEQNSQSTVGSYGTITDEQSTISVTDVVRNVLMKQALSRRVLRYQEVVIFWYFERDLHRSLYFGCGHSTGPRGLRALSKFTWFDFWVVNLVKILPRYKDWVHTTTNRCCRKALNEPT